jgi:DNA helicase-2/ATP-dependent DNA helicase PcrA
MFEWLDHLTEAQRRAVTHEGGPLRILAGAGTGKTTTLSARVAWLLATGVPPERILLLTFTRRAARQMLARTSSLVSAAGLDRGAASPANRVIGGTFHAIAHQTLRRYAAMLGIPEGFSVLDAADAADVIDMVRDEQGHAASTRRRFPRKALLVDIYSAAVNTGRPLSSVVPEMAPWAEDFIDAISEICRGYVRRKRSAGLIDLDDLLLFWRAAVQGERLGPRLAGALDHVLVDEYQDVNDLQVDILTGLRRGGPGITVVGDDAQALYSFRAAEPRHILEFDGAFPGSTTVVLETNYRSSQQILDVANAVGADAKVGFSAVLQAARTVSGTGPQLVRCADEDAQTDAVCDRILAHREAGVALREQAVLVRAAHHSALLELELGARRIPYVKYGGLRFIEAAHVKDMLAAFRLADNPGDVVAWFRLLQLLAGVGPATAHRVVAALGLLGSDDVRRDVEVVESWSRVAAHLPEATRPAAGQLVTAIAARPGESVPTHAVACGRRAAGRRGLPGGFRAARRPGHARHRHSKGRSAVGCRGRSCPRAAEINGSPGRTAADRRGLADHLDGALRQGARVGRRSSASGDRRQHSFGHGAGFPRRPGGRAASVLRGADARSQRIAPLRAGALPPPSERA